MRMQYMILDSKYKILVNIIYNLVAEKLDQNELTISNLMKFACLKN